MRTWNHRTCLTIPSSRCTCASEAVRRLLLLYLRRSAHARVKQLEDIKGDHPWRTGGRPTQELANSNQSIRKRLDFNPSVGLDCNVCGLKGTPCHQQQSVHLKRAALLKGYSPNSSEVSFCVSLPEGFVQQGRQRDRCPQGLV